MTTPSDKHAIFCGFAFFSTFQRQWPPRWTLLAADGCTDRTVPADRADWTVEHWREYAVFLERRGAEHVAALRNLERERPPGPRRRVKLVDRWLQPCRKPGRPKGSRYDDDALAALQIQASARAAGNTMTDFDAVCAVRTARSQRRPRISSPGIRSTINRMVALRKNNHGKPAAPI